MEFFILALAAFLFAVDYFTLKRIHREVRGALDIERGARLRLAAEWETRRNGDLAREVMRAQRLARYEQILTAYGLDELP